MITTYQIGASNLNKYTALRNDKSQKSLFQSKNMGFINRQSSKASIVTSLLGDESAFYDVSEDGDTIELSKRGVEKSQNNTQNQPPGNMRMSPNINTKADETQTPNKDLLAEVAGNDETTDEVSANLTNYTTYELSQLLSKGLITSAEYYIEIARRDELNKSNLA